MKRLITLLLLLVSLSACGTAPPPQTTTATQCLQEAGTQYPAVITRQVDGDTYDIEADLGFSVFTRVRVRLADVDTPEIYGVKKDSEEYQRGKEASEIAAAWLRQRGNEVIVRVEGTGKYGRWIAEIYSKNGESLNDYLRQRYPNE